MYGRGDRSSTQLLLKPAMHIFDTNFIRISGRNAFIRRLKMFDLPGGCNTSCTLVDQSIKTNFVFNLNETK